MAGKKRSSNGQVKPHTQPKPSTAPDVPITEATPPCGQPRPTASTPSTLEPILQPKAKVLDSHPTTPHKQRKKLAKLPNNTRISKRPLLHPALPTPFAASNAPKTVYITATTPYIPCLKRVRKLLAHISKREAQSVAAQGKTRGAVEANGRLGARDVEEGIVGEVRGKGGCGGRNGKGSGGDGGEEVYLKATGRAISRALEVAVHFQAQGDCSVGVDMGSVSAIDDVEVVGGDGGGDDDDDEKRGRGDGNDVPETRIRTLSSVTVSIRLK